MELKRLHILWSRVWSLVWSLVLFIPLGGCSSALTQDDDDTHVDVDDCHDPSTFEAVVVVGFWETTDCSGDPVATNSFPIDNSTVSCYCWPGHSGENSADTFGCNLSNQSFTYTQYTNLTCSTGGGMNTKTVYTDTCVEDVPPSLRARILDYSGCGP